MLFNLVIRPVLSERPQFREVNNVLLDLHLGSKKKASDKKRNKMKNAGKTQLNSNGKIKSFAVESNQLTKKIEEFVLELKGIPISSIPRKTCDGVVILSSTSVAVALKTLADNELVAAPVANSDSEIFTVLNMSTLVEYSLTFMNNLSRLTTDTVDSCLNYIFKGSPPPITTCKQSDSIFDVIKLMTESGVRRVAVFPKDCNKHTIETLCFVLNSSTIVDALSSYIKKSPIANVSVGDLGIIRRKTVAARCTAETWKVFQALSKNKLSQVVIIDKDEKVVASFNVESIKGFLRNDDLVGSFPSLIQPVEEFLKLTKINFQPKVCERNFELGKVISLYDTCNQKIWVVNRKHFLKGVVSSSDLLRLICSHDLKSNANQALRQTDLMQSLPC